MWSSPDNWQNFDGLAINARFDPPKTINGTEADGALLTFYVTYRTAENDPYTQR